MAKRFLTLWFCHLTTDWLTIRRPELEDTPFIFAAPDHGRMITTAVSRTANERRMRRIANAEKQAAKNEAESDRLYIQAKEMISVIPFGQPVLVGHHSEGRDRRYRGKIHDTFGKSFALQEKAVLQGKSGNHR